MCSRWYLQSVLAQAVAADLRQRLVPVGIPVLSIFFHNKRETHQSLDLVLRNLLRQIITSHHPDQHIEIPQEIFSLWKESRFVARQPLSVANASMLLHDLLATFPTKYLIIDAIDEAAGCKNEIDEEIRQLRRSGVCILSTDRWNPRIKYDLACCVACGTGPLELYWQCNECPGHFDEKTWLCQECYMVGGVRCLDSSHAMKPPMKVNTEYRPSPEDIERHVGRFLSDEIGRGDIGDDDHMFSGKISLLGSLRKNLGPEYWDSLPAKVSHAAQGNFLYAHMFLERLRLQRTPAGAVDLTRQLESSALQDVDSQYNDMLSLCLEKNDRYGAQVAQDYLSIVATAHEVLNFDQLSHAAAIEPTDRVLNEAFSRRCCSKEVVRRDTQGLLTVANSKTANSFPVGFFHGSLGNYIESHRSKWFPNATQNLLDVCLSYLNLDIFAKPFDTRDTLEKAVQEHPFASYAACYWGAHAREASSTVENSIRILKLVNDEERLACVLQIAWQTRSDELSSWDVSGGISPLHACAFYGLAAPCQVFLKFDPDYVAVGDCTYNQTALIYACRKGYREIAELLLNAGADPNHLSSRGKTPLIEAIESLNKDIVDLLLRRTDIDVNRKAHTRDGTTALVAAVRTHQENVLEILLARGDTDINITDGFGCTALSRAVQELDLDCVRLLLRYDATDLTIADLIGHRSPLDWTADEFLTRAHSDTALDAIDAIAKELMADRRRPRPSNTAIGVAIANGRLSLLRTYLQVNGLDFTYTDEFGRNFLHLAASTRNHAVVQVIYNEFSAYPSFRIDALDGGGATALHLACRYLSYQEGVATIIFLLEAGADPTLKDSDDFTPMMRARCASPELWDAHIKPIFAAYRIVIPVTVDTPRPTLLSTLRAGNLEAFKVLLESLPDPLDPETDRYNGSTLLWQAIFLEYSHGRDYVEHLLPRSQHFLSTTTHHTCAHLAVDRNSLETLQLLADAGIDLDVRDQWGMTALQLAQSNYRYEMCIFLVARGAALPGDGGLKPGLLHAAVTSGDAGAAQRLLVDAGVDPRHRYQDSGLTALQMAEEQLAEAVQDVNDELIALWNPALMRSEGIFQAEIDRAPEVVRRKEMRDLLREAQRIEDAVGSERHAGARPKRDRGEMMAFLEGLDPKGDMTELVLGEAGTEEGENVAVAVDVRDCATSSTDIKMGTVIKEKAAVSGQGQNMVDLRSQVLGLLLAVVIGWLLATVTQLMQRWMTS